MLPQQDLERLALELDCHGSVEVTYGLTPDGKGLRVIDVKPLVDGTDSPIVVEKAP